MNKDLMIQELKRDEGTKLTVYDDATGKPIKPGSTLGGHATIGTGRALDVNGITPAEADYLLDNDITRTENGLRSSLAWFDTLSDVRQRVLTNMAFQMGVNGLMQFHDLMRYCQSEQWSLAADSMLDSKWATQTPARAGRLEQMMRTNSTDPPAIT